MATAVNERSGEAICKNFLYVEKQFIKNNSLTIKGLEKKLSINIEAAGININLKGTIDRIDEIRESTRLIDYKTGNVDRKRPQS